MLSLIYFSVTLSIISRVVQCRPPNIIVFIADDLGFNDVSWHNEVIISDKQHFEV